MYSVYYIVYNPKSYGKCFMHFMNSRLNQGGSSFVDHSCYFCCVFAMLSCESVYCCLVVTCWKRADLLALVCDVLL